MTTVRQYADSLRAVARNVSVFLGEDVGVQDRSSRATLNVILGMVCVLVKLLVDKGLLTDADITVAFTVFNNDPTLYPDVPDPAPIGSGGLAFGTPDQSDPSSPVGPVDPVPDPVTGPPAQP